MTGSEHGTDAAQPGTSLQTSDPELREILTRWRTDVAVQCGLEERTRLMVQLAATIATAGAAEFARLLRDALRVLSPRELREVVYQAVPYTGLARALDFVELTDEILAEAGIGLPLPPKPGSTAETRHEVGLAVQTRIVGAAQVEAMYAGAREDEEHLQHLLTSTCFGDFVSRDGVDLGTRELLTVAMLAALGGCEPQLRGHVAGNLNVGNTRAQLIGVITAILPFIGWPRTLNALAVVDEVTV